MPSKLKSERPKHAKNARSLKRQQDPKEFGSSSSKNDRFSKKWPQKFNAIKNTTVRKSSTDGRVSKKPAMQSKLGHSRVQKRPLNTSSNSDTRSKRAHVPTSTPLESLSNSNSEDEQGFEEDLTDENAEMSQDERNLEDGSANGFSDEDDGSTGEGRKKQMMDFLGSDAEDDFSDDIDLDALNERTLKQTRMAQKAFHDSDDEQEQFDEAFIPPRHQESGSEDEQDRSDTDKVEKKKAAQQKKLQQQQQSADRLVDDALLTNIKQQERFVLSSGQEVSKEIMMAPDLTIIKQRIEEVKRILADFNQLKNPQRLINLLTYHQSRSF